MQSFPLLLFLCCLPLYSARGLSAEDACGSSKTYEPRTREYWLVIEEEVWDYTPEDINQLKATSLEDNVFDETNAKRIGSEYIKAMYFEYTANFGERKAKTENELHTGNLGPTIRGVVGDTLKIHVRNNGTKQYSAHGHGVQFAKEHEGFFYNDGEPEAAGDFLDPGETHTYLWTLPKRAGPGKNDFSSVLWAYHSHVSVPMDIYSGLVGPIVVVNPAYIVTEEEADNAMPCDVDREVFLYFSVSNENDNKLFDDNFSKLRASRKAKRSEILIEDEDFVESNLMHGMNGYLYGNMPEIKMYIGERVRWYLFSFGTEVDLHSVAWHGHTVETSLGTRAASVFLAPALFQVVDMEPDTPGKWIVECHTHDHLDAGMQNFYTVLES